MHAAAATQHSPSSTTTARTRPECGDRGRLEQRGADARRLTPTKEQRRRPNYTWSGGRRRKIVAVGRQRARRLSAPASPRKAQHLVPQICADGHPSPTPTRRLLLRFLYDNGRSNHQMRCHLRATPPENSPISSSQAGRVHLRLLPLLSIGAEHDDQLAHACVSATRALSTAAVATAASKRHTANMYDAVQ
uniref:Uncharacterized protein n=1 Tax=Plectus sambesii TaxID=2011161 RepID=A0A914VGY4_9BILA